MLQCWMKQLQFFSIAPSSAELKCLECRCINDLRSEALASWVPSECIESREKWMLHMINIMWLSISENKINKIKCQSY